MYISDVITIFSYCVFAKAITIPKIHVKFDIYDAWSLSKDLAGHNKDTCKYKKVKPEKLYWSLD